MRSFVMSGKNNRPTSVKSDGRAAIRWLGVAGVVGLLMFAVACGDDDNSIPIEGNFSNASLNGQYAYTITGIDANGFFSESGVFTADGNGNITSATDDFTQDGSFGSNTVTGAYAINVDGSGDLLLNFSPALVFRIAMSDTEHLYLIQEDTPSTPLVSFGTGAGSAVKQNPSAFTTPAGTFVFQLHGPGAPATVGVMNISGGVITGTEDTLLGGTLNTLSITGTVDPPGTNGRGTLTFTDAFGAQSFIYYVVNANTLRFLQSDGQTLAVGQAEVQSASAFNNATMNGSFVFGSQGDTNTNINAIHSVGVFTADGVGGITGGNFDSVQDGNVQSNVPVTGGTYNVAASGRATVSLQPQTGAAIPEVFWLVNSTRAYYLVNSSTRTEVGTADKQATTAFTNATLNGQYAFFMDGFDGNFKDRDGTFIPDGNGNLRQNQVANSFSFSAGFGQVSPFTSLTGSYSVEANGRVTASVNSLSSNIVMYMVSPSSGYSLQADTGVDIGGALTLQH